MSYDEDSEPFNDVIMFSCLNFVRTDSRSRTMRAQQNVFYYIYNTVIVDAERTGGSYLTSLSVVVTTSISANPIHKAAESSHSLSY